MGFGITILSISYFGVVSFAPHLLGGSFAWFWGYTTVLTWDPFYIHPSLPLVLDFFVGSIPKRRFFRRRGGCVFLSPLGDAIAPHKRCAHIYVRTYVVCLCFCCIDVCAYVFMDTYVLTTKIRGSIHKTATRWVFGDGLQKTSFFGRVDDRRKQLIALAAYVLCCTRDACARNVCCVLDARIFVCFRCTYMEPACP